MEQLQEKRKYLIDIDLSGINPSDHFKTVENHLSEFILHKEHEILCLMDYNLSQYTGLDIINLLFELSSGL